MSAPPLELTREQLEIIARQFPTPFHIYDEKKIREHAQEMNNAFSWIPGFKNYFAVKACPNPEILTILHEEGFGADCSSLPELKLAEQAGMVGEEIMFTSNDTPESEFSAAFRAGAVINLDDITHIETLEKSVGIPELICFRYNPGEARTGNVIIGHPAEAKYGVTDSQIVSAYAAMREKGVKRFGLHTMVASNELNGTYFIETARMLFELAVRLKKEAGVRIEFINMGGGIGIPYRPDEKSVDLLHVSEGMRELYETILVPAQLTPMRIVFECGRMITGPYGYLVSRVRHVAEKYKTYVGLDASMANLMRPALYGAYHHISIPGKEQLPADTLYDVTGSLCENNDKFAIDRKLPTIAPGDFVVIHDAGAHGYAMGFNYNGKLRSSELLLRPDNTVKLIRRAETVDDYFATLSFNEASVQI